MKYICKECKTEIEVEMHDLKAPIDLLPYGAQDRYLKGIVKEKLDGMCLECKVVEYIGNMIPKDGWR